MDLLDLLELCTFHFKLYILAPGLYNIMLYDELEGTLIMTCGDCDYGPLPMNCYR